MENTTCLYHRSRATFSTTYPFLVKDASTKKLAGMIGLRKDDGGDVHNRISTFFVLPEYQGKGIGTMLFKRVLEQAQKLGIKKLVVSSSLNAEDIYKHYGFKRVKVIHKTYSDGTDHKNIWMERKLNSNGKKTRGTSQKQYAIYFDFNGVLAEKISDQDKIIAQSFGIDAQKLNKYIDIITFKPPLINYWHKICDIETENKYYDVFADLVLTHFHIPVVPQNVDKIRKAKHTGVFRLYDDVVETLNTLKPFFRFGLLTNSRPSRRLVEFERLGLSNFFDPEMIIISTEVGFEKPQKEIYELAVQRSGGKASNIVFCDNTKKYLDIATNLGFGDVILFSKVKDQVYQTVSNFSEMLDTKFISRVL